MSSDPLQLPITDDVVWQAPPGLRRRGRRPNPAYDGIVRGLQGRAGVFALVGSYDDYKGAVGVQQVLQNRGCHVTTRRKVGGPGVDVYAIWPEEAPVAEFGAGGDVPAELIWGDPPQKRAGVRQRWETGEK